MLENVEIVDGGDRNDIVEEATNTPLRKHKLKSAVWKDFERIFNEDGSISAKCGHCKRLFVGGRSGTSHLRKHLERCPCKRVIVATPLQAALEAPSLDNDKTASSSQFEQKQAAQSAPARRRRRSKDLTFHRDKLASFVQFYQQQMADFQQFQLQQMSALQKFQQKQMADFLQFYQQQMSAIQQFQQQDVAGQELAAFDLFISRIQKNEKGTPK